MPTIRTCFDLVVMGMVGREILAAYVGKRPVREIVHWSIRRGQGRNLAAAMLFADLRGFTEMLDVVEPIDGLRALDAYLCAIGGSVSALDGEIIKFIGDGVLVLFSKEDGLTTGCCNAYSAAVEAIDSVSKIPRPGVKGAGLKVGIALHVGPMFFGNVGAGDRLDFTVEPPPDNCLGAAGANPNVRSSCEGLGAHTRPAGKHFVKGFANPLRVFRAD